MADKAEELRRQILQLVEEYHREAFCSPWSPRRTHLPISGRVFDQDELVHLVDASLDFWLTMGRYAATFEKQIAEFCEVRCATLVNSGSSANLAAISALTSVKLKERSLRPGDEVITAAAGFPTTVNPIVQNNATPVFVDVRLPTFQADASQLEEALSERTKAVIFAHTLGNPFDLDAVCRFAAKHNLWVVEDCCDALGAAYGGKRVGSFGALSTLSFYPAHQITMGEGGCVLTNSPLLKTIVESFRDWGRDCWCAPGDENTCGKRFDGQLGTLPRGYDHKYTYSHIGYNLKLTDMQAAVGVAQLKKLDGFIARRNSNWQLLRRNLEDLEEVFILPEPTPNSQPSWFGFPFALRESAPFDRTSLVRYLEARGIATRPVFAGNLVRQPAYQGVKYRQIGDLSGTDFLMDHGLWIGVYPGLSPDDIGFMIETLHAAVKALQP
jgi:CDP-6-deoxy-D-xylo-4-hexulose-3-dehydrase